MKIFEYSQLNEYKWDSEVISLIAQIHEHKGKQSLYLKQKPQALEQLIEIAKIQSTESSNKIEGIVTTSTRIKQLMSDKTTPRNRDEEEILGYRNALNIIHESFEYNPISPNYILPTTSCNYIRQLLKLLVVNLRVFKIIFQLNIQMDMKKYYLHHYRLLKHLKLLEIYVMNSINV